ncbi:MAG: hypothetical protein A2508_10155 [Candidatus Lambdaproteobacteria bacterium RIFOXYD12_FULL_49_8]|nr:MAG: hypothetical protein A2508_10155 [Candidatus Lambdaproteobacteria bacterium RIFOXYD12_FULL_49_8]
MKNATLKVQKMKCGGCTSKVEGIAKEFGLAEAKASFETGLLELGFEGDPDLNQLAQKITQAGYPAQLG